MLHGLQERLVSPLHSSSEHYALAAFFALRARAAQNRHFWYGLKAVI